MPRIAHRIAAATILIPIFLCPGCGDGNPSGSLCGNGSLDPDEQCDDGNNDDGDGCSAQCLSEQVAYADLVVEAPGHTGSGYGDSANAVNGVRGCGSSCGGADVFSLGYTADQDSYMVLRWSERRVLNGPGADFTVFENGFAYSGSSRFMDHIVVYVSQDAVTWVPMPHDYTASDETVYEPDPALWQGFAGVQPALLHEEDNPVDPFDHEAAGGDPFDLDVLPDDGGPAQAVKEQGFVYLMLVTAPTVVNPDTGAPFVRDAISNGADIDGVYARWLVPEWQDRTAR